MDAVQSIQPSPETRRPAAKARMYPAPFALERFFAQHEFTARYLLSASDCQGLAMADLVAGADPDLRSRWETLSPGLHRVAGTAGAAGGDGRHV